MSTTTTNTTGTTGELDRLAEVEFADLVYDDAELLRAEFDELIAASWDEPPPRRPPSPPRRPARLPRPHTGRAPAHTEVGSVVSDPAAVARQRGPPSLSTG